MTKRRYPIAARVPFGIEPEYRLVDRLHLSLRDQREEMLQSAEQTQMAQDASSAIYVYALAKADATLHLAELIKAARSPFCSTPELEAFHRALQAEYLAHVQKIASRGAHRVFAALSWKGGT